MGFMGNLRVLMMFLMYVYVCMYVCIYIYRYRGYHGIPDQVEIMYWQMFSMCVYSWLFDMYALQAG